MWLKFDSENFEFCFSIFWRNALFHLTSSLRFSFFSPFKFCSGRKKYVHAFRPLLSSFSPTSAQITCVLPGKRIITGYNKNFAIFCKPYIANQKTSITASHSVNIIPSMFRSIKCSLAVEGLLGLWRHQEKRESAILFRLQLAILTRAYLAPIFSPLFR